MTDMIKLQTKYFGEIEYEAGDVLHFPDGLFGFEEEQGFLLLPFEGGGGMLCLQSVKTPALAFVALDPFSLKPDYAPELERAELKAFGVKETGEGLLCAVRGEEPGFRQHREPEVPPGHSPGDPGGPAGHHGAL